MRTFEEFPKASICPICKNNDKGECVLVAIIGKEEGTICEALPFHLGCLELRYDNDRKLIYQIIE